MSETMELITRDRTGCGEHWCDMCDTGGHASLIVLPPIAFQLNCAILAGTADGDGISRCQGEVLSRAGSVDHGADH